jgi:hypothetical protein
MDRILYIFLFDSRVTDREAQQSKIPTQAVPAQPNNCQAVPERKVPSDPPTK